MRKLPDVSTISRALCQMEDEGVDSYRQLSRDLVTQGLLRESLPRQSLDFDSLVITTKGHIEGTAVGFNKSKKGTRSYYPLFCTVAQTGHNRFIFTRCKTRKQHKGPIKLDLFEPLDFNYDYKVIVTNKSESTKAVILFHNGRGSQEAIFGGVKGDCGLNVIPTRRLTGNPIYTLCSVMAHNLTREI